jgi:glycerophosphoryl diester phosphodiesterase
MSTLDQVLEIAAGRAEVFVELKSPWAYRRFDVAALTLAAFEQHRLGLDAVAVLSFEPAVLRRARELRPGLRTLRLFSAARTRPSLVTEAVDYAWAVGIEESAATPRLLELGRSLGLVTSVYTVDDPDRARELVAAGIDFLITNRRVSWGRC